MTIATFEVRAGRALLRCQSKGAGKSVVFLHAGVADSRMFTSQLDCLGKMSKDKERLAISYDRRGFGYTHSPDEPFSHVEDLSAVLNSCEIETTTLVGCSQGGRIAIDFALANPQRVKSLVLISTTYPGAPRGRFDGKALALGEALETAEGNLDLDEVNRIEAHMWLDGPESAEGRVTGPVRGLFLDMNGIALRAPEFTREREPPSAAERLGEISCPVLLIEGALDFAYIKQGHDRIELALRQCRRVVIADAAHLPGLEHPDELHRLLSDFFADAAKRVCAP